MGMICPKDVLAQYQTSLRGGPHCTVGNSRRSQEAEAGGASSGTVVASILQGFTSNIQTPAMVPCAGSSLALCTNENEKK